MRSPIRWKLVLAGVALIVGGVILPLAPGKAQGAPAALDRESVPAAGRSEALIQVSEFGRYAIAASSEQGVALQLIDRMSGPGGVNGIPGEKDGRVDGFLDRGEYQLVTRGHAEGQGNAKLAVHPFRELNEAIQLVELRLVEQELGDLEQRSYWLNVRQSRWIALEAAGRYLTDLRLWRDGSWLVDAEPEREVVEPVEARPLLACRLATRLEPGLYRLIAYGGPGQPWAEESDDKPLYLRWGIPKLAAEGRAQFRASPFGADRWLVPARANYFRLELPEARPASLGVDTFDESRPFRGRGRTAQIDKDSRLPLAEVNDGSGNGFDVVTVRAAAGEPYVLQQFESRWQYHFQKSGNHWISTIHSGHPSDSVDATGILVRNADSHKTGVRPVMEQVVELDHHREWSSRFNLLDTLTLFVRVTGSGSYRVGLEGVAARYRFEPFLLSRPRDYKTPPLRSPGTSWDLTAGYYVLTVEPEEKGIVTVDLRGRAARSSTPRPARASVRFESVRLDNDRSGYTLSLNRQPGVRAGIILRPLPLDLREPLPIALEPGKVLSLPVRVAEPSRIVAVAEDGSRVDVSQGGDPLPPAHILASGRHTLQVGHQQSDTVWISVGLHPTRLDAGTPLPALPDRALAALPKFPEVGAGAPHRFELDRSERATFLVHADRDAMYRLETTGLLDTEGVLRSRVITSLARSAGGGTGRNFFLQQYLRTGEYQLTVNTRGRSQGHLGLELTAAGPLDGGELRDGTAARIALGPGESIAYTFEVHEAGEYRLRSLGLGRTFTCRLEDADGWPVKPPNIPADFTDTMEPGRYRLILLPEPVASRRVTLLERSRPPLRFAGHGPHVLPLSTPVQHRWQEPDEGDPRAPDVWQFDLPADARAEIVLRDGMMGRLFREGADKEVARIPVSKGWRGDLTEGRYRLEAVCARINNNVDYGVEVRSHVLIPGLSLAVTAPATVPVAVGGGSLVELSSIGSADVRARLLDETGHVVAARDDREGDWNFQLAVRLAPGRYTLEVDPVAAATADTRVTMETREAVVHDPVDLPASWNLDPGTGMHLYPLSPPAGTGVLLVSAAAAESVGLALEVRRENGRWEDLSVETGRSPRLEVALPIRDPLRLRAWSADLRGNPVILRVAAAGSEPRVESNLGEGDPAPQGFSGDVAVYDLLGPGTLRLDSNGAEVRWADRPGAALMPVSRGLVTPTANRLWVASPGGTPGGRRVVLASGDGDQIAVAAGRRAALDLAPADGPQVVEVSAVVGQPAVTFTEATNADAARDSGVSAQGAAAVALGGGGGRAWFGPAEANGRGVDVRIRHLAYPPVAVETTGFGRLQGELRGRISRGFALPAGAKRFRINTSGNLVAAFAEDRQVQGVHWDGPEPLARWGHTEAKHLYLFHTRPEADRFSVELFDDEGVPVLSTGSPFEAVPGHTGTLSLRVRGPGRIHVHGAREQAILRGPDGAVARGTDLAVGDGEGELLLPHGPGLIMAWLSTGADREAGLWPPGSSTKASEVGLPAALALEGEYAALRLAREDPALLQVRVDTPCAIRLTGAGRSRTRLLAEGGTAHLYLGPGEHELTFRPLGRDRLGGRAELTADPVPVVGEGLGPELLLAPGDGRAFRFPVTRPGGVGVGVRADADVVDLTLADATGKLLGEGVVQMHELTAGEYVLVLENPKNGTPVRARPVVVGLEPPDRGPPEEVIRGYVEEGR